MQHSEKHINRILNECVEKKQQAQKELYELFAGKMYAVCLYYAGNKQDAEDILQDGFIKVFDYIHQYNKKGSLEGWMRRVFVNTALTLFRKRKILYEEEEKINTIEEKKNVEQDISANDLMKIIMSLSPKYRLVFNLYALEGYTHAEISEKLNISINTSKSNLARARKILQDKVVALKVKE